MVVSFSMGDRLPATPSLITAPLTRHASTSVSLPLSATNSYRQRLERIASRRAASISAQGARSTQLIRENVNAVEPYDRDFVDEKIRSIKTEESYSTHGTLFLSDPGNGIAASDAQSSLQCAVNSENTRARLSSPSQFPVPPAWNSDSSVCPGNKSGAQLPAWEPDTAANSENALRPQLPFVGSSNWWNAEYHGSDSHGLREQRSLQDITIASDSATTLQDGASLIPGTQKATSGFGLRPRSSSRRPYDKFVHSTSTNIRDVALESSQLGLSNVSGTNPMANGNDADMRGPDLGPPTPENLGSVSPSVYAPSNAEKGVADDDVYEFHEAPLSGSTRKRKVSFADPVNDEEDSNKGSTGLPHDAVSKSGKRRRSKKPISSTRIPTSEAELGPSDELICRLRTEGKTWPEVQAVWEAFTGRKVGHSTLSNRYSRLRLHMATFTEDEDALFLRLKNRIEGCFEREKWQMVSDALKKEGKVFAVCLADCSHFKLHTDFEISRKLSRRGMMS